MLLANSDLSIERLEEREKVRGTLTWAS